MCGGYHTTLHIRPTMSCLVRTQVDNTFLAKLSYDLHGNKPVLAPSQEGGPGLVLRLGPGIHSVIPFSSCSINYCCSCCFTSPYKRPPIYLSSMSIPFAAMNTNNTPLAASQPVNTRCYQSRFDNQTFSSLFRLKTGLTFVLICSCLAFGHPFTKFSPPS